QILIRLVRIGAAHHGDVVQIILKGVIAHLHRNDLKCAIHDAHDGKKPGNSFNCSHVPTIHSARGLKTVSSRPSEQFLKMVDDRRNRNIAYFTSRTQNDFHSTFGNLLSDCDSKGDTDQVRVLEFDPGAFVAVVENHVEAGRF